MKKRKLILVENIYLYNNNNKEMSGFKGKRDWGDDDDDDREEQKLR